MYLKNCAQKTVANILLFWPNTEILRNELRQRFRYLLLSSLFYHFNGIQSHGQDCTTVADITIFFLFHPPTLSITSNGSTLLFFLALLPGGMWFCVIDDVSHIIYTFNFMKGLSLLRDFFYRWRRLHMRWYELHGPGIDGALSGSV